MNTDFDLDEQGMVKAPPLVEYKIMSFAGMAAVVRLGYAPSEEALKTMTFEHVQMALTPAQCRELGEALLRTESSILAHTNGPLQG